MRVRRAVAAPSAETLVIAACAAVACALRGYQLARPGYLLGLTEYDDGVLFGNALRLVSGVVPYRDFAMVQPPGSMLLIAPVALLAKVSGTAWGLAAARVLTASADTGNAILLGLLVRHRGPLAAGVASGLYAVDPDAITAAHTFLLEPWLNLFCLAGALLIVDGDRVTADARRLAWGGAAFGFAAAIKIWALVPLGVVALLLAATACRSRSRSRRRRPRPVAALAGGAALGLGLPLLPFVALAPGAVVRGVVISQEVRNADGHGSPLGRLADLTGLQLLPVRADRGLALLVIAVAVTAGYAAVYLATRRRPAALVAHALDAHALDAHALDAHALDAHALDAHGPDAHGPDTYSLDTYALAGAVAVTAMFLWPRLYYSHYGAFDGPFLALAVALPAGRLVTGRLVTGRLVTGGPAASREAAASRWTAAALTALVLVLGAAVALQFRAESALRGVPAPAAADRLIPPGACVLTNDPAYTVAVDRFYSDAPGCPAMVDSFGTLIALTSGRSRDTAAPVLRPVVELWRADLGRAGYVWLTGDTAGQIPWTGPLDAYFRGHFRLIGLTQPHSSSRLIPRPGLYVRR